MALLTGINIVEITPGTASAWVTVDVSSYVPAGATGVVLHIVNTSGNDYNVGFQKNGSNDNRTNTITSYSHFWASIGIDADRKLQLYVTNKAYIDIYLTAYYGSEAFFFSNAIDKSLSSTYEWIDIDISSNTGEDTAIGAIFEVIGSNYKYGFRKKGSEDDRCSKSYHSAAIIGVDNSEVCQGYIVNTNTDFFLVGYVKSGAVFNTNAANISLSTTGAWTDLTALPSGGKFGFIETVDFSGDLNNFGLRENDSGEDITKECKHTFGIIKADVNRIIEGYIAISSTDFFLVGYAINVVNQIISPPVATTTFSASIPEIKLGITLVASVATASFTALAPSTPFLIVYIENAALIQSTALTPAICISRNVPVENVAPIQFTILIPAISCGYTITLPAPTTVIFAALVPESVGEVPMTVVVVPVANITFNALASSITATYDYFPLKSPAGQRMMEYLPQYYLTSNIMRRILVAQGYEVDALEIALNGILQQFFSKTVDWAIEKWEYELGLKATPDLDLDERRRRVQMKLKSFGTATIRRIKELNKDMGFGESEVIEDHSVYAVYIRFIEIEGKPLGVEFVQAILREFIPAHLTIDFIYSFFTWAEWDNINETWDDFDALNMTWDDLEIRS